MAISRGFLVPDKKRQLVLTGMKSQSKENDAVRLLKRDYKELTTYSSPSISVADVQQRVCLPTFLSLFVTF